MHSPETLAHEIKSPFKREDKFFPNGYRNTLVSIWHVDPETDGSDDSCGWFMRSRHGNKETLKKIIKRFEYDWDTTFQMNDKDWEDEEVKSSKENNNKIHSRGLFHPNGDPNMSVSGIVLNLFFLAACEHFDSDGHSNWKKANRFMKENLFDILMFAENPIDSLNDAILQPFGKDIKREDRIEEMAKIIYGWILRKERPWYKHPKWHIHHWKVNIDVVSKFKRWAFSKCCKCGKGFSWGYSPISNSWDSDGPRWFKSEKHVYHFDCSRPSDSCCGQIDKTK